jgi:hypothetical protein
MVAGRTHRRRRRSAARHSDAHAARAVWTALLALVAGSLFALRYGLDRRLDLRAPLARIVQDKLGYTEARQAARDRQNPAPHDPKHPEDPGFSLDDSQQKSPGELDAAPESALDTVGVPDVDNKTASSRPDNSKLAQSTQLEGEQKKRGTGGCQRETRRPAVRRWQEGPIGR